MSGILRLGAAIFSKIGQIAKAVAPAIARTGNTIRGAATKLGRRGNVSQLETEPDTGQKLLADETSLTGSSGGGNASQLETEPDTGQKLLADETSLAGSSGGGSTNAVVGPVRIQAREQANEEYVTYTSLYSILVKYTDRLKSFIVSTLQSLQAPIFEMEKHTTKLLEIVKGWTNTTGLSQKRARGKNIEETTEGRYRGLTDKQILTTVRGDTPNPVMGIIERIVRGITGALFVGLGLFGDKFDDILKTVGATLMDWAKKAFDSLYNALVQKYPLLGKTVDLVTESPEEDTAAKAYSKLGMYRAQRKEDRDPIVEAELEADYLGKQAAAHLEDKNEQRASKYSRAAEAMKQKAERLRAREDKKAQPSALSIFKQKALDPFYAPSSTGQDIQTKTEESKKRASGPTTSPQAPSLSVPTDSASSRPVYPTQASLQSVPSLSPNSTLPEVNHG